ncbi:extracellular ligand-binding receptor [Pyrobaculum neutrophilum V24Sta]|uniref:Extracellular ligand-binding receptor n=2 Tax=Pyrobaculum neutrophilum TaxID=70771 RepID=B1Y8T3_PYRNV|nr:extracellular ligand-binding receptor [Pyrobaculum neutrophilum V24Sta]
MLRRDLLKIGGGFIVGLAAGYGIGKFFQPATVEVVKPGGTETIKAATTTTATKARPKTFKLAVVAYQSGAASVFGVPAVNMAKLLVDRINAGGGINGVPVELVVRDEAGGPDQMVALYRQLTQQEGVDAYVGLISSADCLAVAPVAEQLGTALTVFFDCATKQLVDKGIMKKVTFRTATTTAQDNVALVKYLLEVKPDFKTVVGINQDYAYGRDNWADFTALLKRLKPDVQILSELWTPLFTTDYSAQIGKILDLKPDLVYTSFWGPDLANFVQQASARGLFKVTTVAFTRGESMLQDLKGSMPPGQIVQAPHYFEYPDPRLNLLNREIAGEYRRRYGSWPPYPAYHMANAILGVKYAYEAAAAVYGVDWPDVGLVAKVFERLAYPSPGDYIMMTPVHNAAKGVVVGTTAEVQGYDFRLLRPYRYMPPAEITPTWPSEEWYKQIG